VTLFASELATTTVTDVRTYTLPHLIYKDAKNSHSLITWKVWIIYNKIHYKK